MNSIYYRFRIVISIYFCVSISLSAQEKHTLILESFAATNSIILERIVTPDSVVIIDNLRGKINHKIITENSFIYRLHFPETNYKSDDFICDGKLKVSVSKDLKITYSRNITNDKYQAYLTNILNPFRMALTQLTITLDYITSINDSLSLSALSKAQNEVVKFYSLLLNKFSEEEKQTIIGLYNLMYHKKNYNKSEREALINQFPRPLRSHQYAQYFY